MEAANKIAIITDTCCDLPQEYLKEYPIFCVPLVVTSGTESYRDNIDITVETIYARQKNENFKTSLPRPQDIEDVYSAIARQGYTHVIVLMIKNALITAFSEFKVAAADIKIAARALHTGKSRAFLEESLAPCDTLDLEELIDAASKDTDTFYAYLSRTDYADGVKALKDGFSAFEKWCDDRQTALVKEISRQDYFTVAPLLGYVTARQNEISTVRIIISGKQNNLPDERIRARLRDL